MFFIFTFKSNVCLLLTGGIGTSTPTGCGSATSVGGLAESDGCLMGFAFSVWKILHSATCGNISEAFGISEGPSAFVCGVWV